MAEAVYDTSFIAYANCSLEDPTAGRREFLRQLVAAIEQATSGTARVRWNKKLYREYSNIVKEHRNDVIDQFFLILTSVNATLVDRNLRSHELSRANDCDWPYHDRHLIAAAIDGADVTIHVTEDRLGECATKVWRVFRIRINHVSPVLPEV